MSTTNPPEPDLGNATISVSTDEVGLTTSETVFAPADAPPLSATSPTPLAAAGPGSPVGSSGPEVPTASAPTTEEVPIWEARYSFANFAGRLFIGFLLIAACLALIVAVQAYGHHGFRPIVYIVGVLSTGYWLWLAFRIFRARFGHHYRLTSHRLFVRSGMFRRQEDMLELGELKEVSVSQQGILDHLFKIGTVIVHSKVNGAPVMFLIGVKDPQVVMDSIFHHARD